MQKMIHARRLTAVLSVAAVAALGITTTPALAAKPPSNKALNRDVIKVDKALKTAITTIGKTTKSLQSNVNTLNQEAATVVPEIAATNTTLSATNASLTALTAKVTSLSSAFASGSTTVTAGLQALQTAIQDPNTGLVGLNTARPRFVSLTSAGAGQPFTVVAGSSTPEANVSIISGSQTTNGSVLLDFGEDVHQRALVVTPVAGTGTFAVGQAVDCGNAPGICGTDTSNNHVLVTTEALTAGGPVEAAVPVTVIALAG